MKTIAQRTLQRTLGHHAFTSRAAEAQQLTQSRELQAVGLQRRRFLQGLAKAGIAQSALRASPLLAGVFAQRQALASAEAPKRLIYCYLPNGAASGFWMPSSAQTMNVCTKPYGPDGYDVAGICHFRQINVLQTGHAMAYQALGAPYFSPPPKTMDQRLSGVLNAFTPFPYMYVGVRATTAGSLCSTIGPCSDGVEAAFNTYFQAAAEKPRLENLFKLHQDALTRVGQKLSQEEKQGLEQHAEALRSIAQKLDQRTAVQACEVSAPELSESNQNMENMQEQGKILADLIIAAMQCGLTNLATLQLGNHQGDWYMHEGEFKQDFHQAQNTTVNNYNEMVAYLSDVPAYFIRQLIDKKGPDNQPLIDSTVLAQVTCMGDGQDHSSANAPFILATRMPGFATGFSASTGGTTLDFNGAIPKGMAIPEGTYQPMGEDDLELLA